MKKTARIAAVAAVAALALSACGEREDSSTTSEPTTSTTEAAPSESSEQYPDTKACMVSDSGGFDDKSFNQTALKGQTDAESMFGVQTAQVESNADSEYADNINQLVQDGCSIITTVGFLLGDATEAAAKKNKNVDFAIVDYAYEKPSDNLKGLVFATDQPSFMAGYLAAAQTETGVVGTFGGLNIPTVTVFMEGFRRGIEYFNEENGGDVQLLGWDGSDGSFTEDFEDKTKGQQVAEQMIQQGADIIFPVAGPAGLGGLQAASENDAFGIWVDVDGYESTEYGDILLTSVVKGIDVAVTEAIRESGSGEFSNELFSGTLENGGVSLAPFHDFDGEIDQEVKDALTEIQDGIISGEIQTS